LFERFIDWDKNVFILTDSCVLLKKIDDYDDELLVVSDAPHCLIDCV